MGFVSGTGYVVDEVYIASVHVQVWHPDKAAEQLRISREFDIKPVAVDDILWAAFMPESVTMGKRMRLNRRINGSCQVSALTLVRDYRIIKATDPVDWGPLLDQFEPARAEFIEQYPTPAGFVAALEHPTIRTGGNRELTRMTTSLMAAGRPAEAARLADEAIGTGESGGMSSTTDVLNYLSAYAKGPQAFSDFKASLVPTHDYSIINHSRPSLMNMTLCRAYHRGTMRRTLESFNGSDPWAFTLSIRPPAGAPVGNSTLRYLQAAGSAEAMVVEICEPGGTEHGCVAVRAIVGHPVTGPVGEDVDIQLPEDTQAVKGNEVFTADEAAGMFENYYRTGEIGDVYLRRPVEGYRLDGAQVPLDTDGERP